jgi:serine/threonine-protein kinase
MDRLGEGGMSVVWRARDLVLDREVAIKVLTGVGRVLPFAGIRAEACAVARLAHPYVAKVYDYGEVLEPSRNPVPFVVMELLPGVCLGQLAAFGPMQPRLALRICAQVAEALAHAHSCGLVHRDVKPDNVMVTETTAKIFDFGIAAAVGTAENPTRLVLGTVNYLAPERIVGGLVTPASDVYSLALMLYRLLTYDFPWHAVTHPEIMRAHVYSVPTGLPRMHGVTSEVRDLYWRCVDKVPAARPTATEVADVLTAALRRTSGPVVTGVDNGQRAAEPRLKVGSKQSPTLAHIRSRALTREGQSVATQATLETVA